MEEWTTIWDHELARFGRRSITFRFENGSYRVDVDDNEQDQILVSYSGQQLRWTVLVKQVNDGVFRLQGMTSGLGDPYEDGGDWFELTLSTPSVMRFWGDQVLVHENNEVLD
ncbi:hypothetical protein [Mesorhizobium captivum]|uniref:hypothetical protein n=1 Tax=Mesorhizobium captivum TaxID=3072319 RepID=UPI002A24C9A9|nr:hypothetical protein [Mesorhizobium sp. VK3C]MDX8444550.1 hypothetical protein [Mesorhizobium sp. VK3C]